MENYNDYWNLRRIEENNKLINLLNKQNSVYKKILKEPKLTKGSINYTKDKIKENIDEINRLKMVNSELKKTITKTKKKKTSKLVRVSKVKKSLACSKVLQLMDQDYSYQKALNLVLRNDKRLNKVKLENELNYYI